MPTDRTNQVLDEFSALTNAARRPDSPAQRVAIRSRFPVATLSGAGLVVAALAVAGILLGRPGATTTVGASPSSPATAAATASPSAAAVATVGPSQVPVVIATPVPTRTPTPTVGPCDVAVLSARITAWEGAAGNRIATVTLKNTGSTTCFLQSTDRPQLVDRAGTVLIDGAAPTSRAVIQLAAGAVVSTLVDASNGCGPNPVPPVHLTFVLADGRSFDAAPLSPTDATVPPCNSSPGTPGSIAMHPWSH